MRSLIGYVCKLKFDRISVINWHLSSTTFDCAGVLTSTPCAIKDIFWHKVRRPYAIIDRICE